METTKNNEIFLVDDDKMFLATMKLYVSQFFRNYNITTFTTGEECLKYLYKKPGIVFLDYFLNGVSPNAMNGIKVLSQIKKTNPDVNVVMFSAQDHIDVAVDTMKYGAFDYIVKNERMFLRVQNAMKNIIRNFSLKREMKAYQYKTFLMAGLIFLIMGVLVYIRIFHKGLLNM
jgi:two-component system OmpR family response regulator